MTPLTLEASGRRFGHYVWAERRLFEVLGAWSGDTRDLAARPVFAASAAHHAWRAGVLSDRLPRARGLDVAGWIAPPNEAVAECLAVLTDPGPGMAADRLVGVYRVVVPNLIEAFEDHIDRTTAIADRPGTRWLRLVLQDELADLRRGVELLNGHDESAADAHRRRVAELLAEGGGLTGDLRAVQNASGDEQSSTPRLPSERTHQ